MIKQSKRNWGIFMGVAVVASAIVSVAVARFDVTGREVVQMKPRVVDDSPYSIDQQIVRIYTARKFGITFNVPNYWTENTDNNNICFTSDRPYVYQGYGNHLCIYSWEDLKMIEYIWADESIASLSEYFRRHTVPTDTEYIGIMRTQNDLDGHIVLLHGNRSNVGVFFEICEKYYLFSFARQSRIPIDPTVTSLLQSISFECPAKPESVNDS